ncbi:DUF421 domain-containing protein [Opitutus terrae]|uniref:YetF C-terminal domain-containing protein n=1 Tax=Opitutus terrae (strain DSM 11246 / JCM 15787 / PB90-1) TaxID=452637 RepID=B1ZNW8_OPITP|nr:YetF domain-containing protein [Opitutus terrae]ACB75485.1 conserved hypothetical protein [Opitutus terrae PB90-1]
MESFKILVDTWLGLNAEPHQLLFPQMALRALVVFVAALIMLRLSHKRFFARRNAIDVLLTFVLASTLARAINGSAAFFPTLATGFVLVFVHRGFTFLGARWGAFGRLAKGEPATLIENGRVHEKTLRAHSLSRDDLAEDLRISGVADPREVRQALLERNGQISVLKR